MSEVEDKGEAVRTAFHVEFAPFADLQIDGLSLDAARELMRQLTDLKVRHTGKRSEIAGTMKLIGQVPPEERAAVGQVVQTVEKEITASLENAEQVLKDHILD